MRKFSRGIQGCHLKADVRLALKMWWLFILSFFKPELWLLKVNGVWNFEFVIKIMRCPKKKTRLQFFVLTSAIESASKHTYWLVVVGGLANHHTFYLIFFVKPSLTKITRITRITKITRITNIMKRFFCLKSELPGLPGLPWLPGLPKL